MGIIKLLSRRLALLITVLLAATVGLTASVPTAPVSAASAKTSNEVCFKTPNGKTIMVDPRNIQRKPGILSVSVFNGQGSNSTLVADYITYDTAGMQEIGEGYTPFAGSYKGYSVDKPGVNDPNQPGAKNVPLLVQDDNESVTAKIVTVAIFYGKPVKATDTISLATATDGKIMKGALQPC